MKTLKLNICTFELHNADALSPTVRNLPHWIHTLPMGDAATTATQLFNVLHQYNTCELVPAIRFDALAAMESTILQASRSLCATYVHSAFPLNERNRQRFHLVCGLFDQLAIGYKTIVVELNKEQAKNQNSYQLFLNAIHKSVVFLAQLLVQCYTVYAKEPDDIWGELNQLYYLAETLGANNIILNKEKNLQAAMQTIEFSYLRITLLSIANPYHLMQGEAELLYDYLKQWTLHCHIQKIIDPQSLTKDLVLVEFDRESPPQLYFEERDIDVNYTRFIDLSAIRNQFNETLSKITRYLYSETANSTFSERMRRDMLLRIQRVWNERQTRQFPRTTTLEYLILATGLNVSHYFITKQNEFMPERAEILYYRPNGIVKKLALQSSGYEHWKSSGINAYQRSLTTDADDYDAELHLWHKIHSNNNNNKTSREVLPRQYNTHRWMLNNQSDNGIGLRRNGVCASCVRVGDIVSYKRSLDMAGWHIGVVRWLKELDKNVLELGVNIIQGVPRAVAVRAVEGANCGQEYFRCLLLERHMRGQSYITIIVPVSTFEIGMQVLINSTSQLQYVVLTDLVATTTSYSQFEFEVCEIPETEQRNIDIIKGA